ncbi:helix-turn-helix domain-containing protein [Flavobacterium sp. FlaQc-48]|uniref:helix-turn-helix domain-containing protein n=1 Tax=Flavobacterium sp. FlaQc-48 TaxID=3374181 RepID=UPI00375653B7
MQAEIIQKIKRIRLEKGISLQEMADRLNIDLSAYLRLESGKTCTWGKYLEDLLLIFELSPEDFFKGIGKKKFFFKRKNSFAKISYVENLHAEYKKKVEQIEFLYQESLKDKDAIIEMLKSKLKNKDDN